MLAWVMNLNFRASPFVISIPAKEFISQEADQTYTSLEEDMTLVAKEAGQEHTSLEEEQSLISIEADQTKDNPRC